MQTEVKDGRTDRQRHRRNGQTNRQKERGRRRTEKRCRMRDWRERGERERKRKREHEKERVDSTQAAPAYSTCTLTQLRPFPKFNKPKNCNQILSHSIIFLIRLFNVHHIFPWLLFFVVKFTFPSSFLKYTLIDFGPRQSGLVLQCIISLLSNFVYATALCFFSLLCDSGKIQNDRVWHCHRNFIFLH